MSKLPADLEARLEKALNRVFRDRLLRQGSMETWVGYFTPILVEVVKRQREGAPHFEFNPEWPANAPPMIVAKHDSEDVDLVKVDCAKLGGRCAPLVTDAPGEEP